MLRRNGFLAALLLLAGCVEAGVDTIGPDVSHPVQLQLSLAPTYVSALSVAGVSAAPAPIRRIRLTALMEGTDEVITVSVVDVDPSADFWDISLEIEVKTGSGRVRVLVELLSVEDGVEGTEWSGRAGPFEIQPGQSTRSEAVDLFRGPPGNLNVTGVAIGGGPLDLAEGQSGNLTVEVEGAEAPIVFWGVLDPAIASVGPEGEVQGILPGVTQVVAEAGPRADTVEVRVRQRVDEIRLELDALAVDALMEEVPLEAQALDPRGAEVAEAELAFAAEPAGILEHLGAGLFRSVATGEGRIVVTAPGFPGVEAQLPFQVVQTVVGVEVIPEVLLFTYLGEELEVEAQAWDRNGVGVPDPGAQWTVADPEGGGGPSPVEFVEPGRLRAVGDGETRLHARVGEVEASAPVQVARVATSLVVDPAALSLSFVGERQRISATALDAGGSPMPPTGTIWSTPSPNVVELEPADPGETGSAGSSFVDAVARGPGRALLSAQLEGLQATVDAEVVQRPHSMALIRSGSPQGAAGESLAELPMVVVLDQGGTPVPGASLEFRTLDGGSVAPSTVVTNAAGQGGPTTWILGPTPGPQRLRMELAGNPGVEGVQVEVAVTPGAPHALLVIQGGEEQHTDVGTAVPQPPAVRVMDALENPVPGVPVTFEVRAGGGTVTPTQVVSGPGGEAGVESWMVGEGLNSLWATAPGITDAAVFVAQGELVGPGPPSLLEKILGEGQLEIPGSPLPTPLVVRVLDGEGSPIPDVLVDFLVTAGGGTVEFPQATTGADGLASGGVWTLGGASGTQTVEAQVGGELTVAFTAQAAPDFVVLGVDAGGNPDPVLFTKPDGAPTWTARTSPVDGAVLTLATDGTRFLAGGTGSNTLALSDDGVTWTPVSTPLTTAVRGLALGNPQWVAVGEGSTPLATSPDGVNWTARSPPGGTFMGHGVAYGDGLWVAVGEGSQTILSSTDGVTWTDRSPPGLDMGLTVAWNGSLWVAGGSPADGGSSLYVSEDGVAWTPVTGDLAEVKGVAWNGGRWQAVGVGQVGVTHHTATSLDGHLWTPATTEPASGSGRGILWDGSLWWNLRDPTPGGSTLVVSDNDTDWIALAAPSPYGLTDLTRRGVSLHPFPWNRAPTVAITSLSGTLPMSQGDLVVVEAEGVDPEDGMLGPGALSWSSSLDGALGTGTSLSLATLSVGNHLVTVTATDGNGAVARQRIEVEVVEATPPPLPGSPLAAGWDFTCGVGTAGGLYCWGTNWTNQLGDGTTVNQRDTPVAIGGGLLFASVSTGWDHGCGVTQDGVGHCWGSNQEGNLGDGTTTDRTTPTPVAGGLEFATIDAHYYHSCGVTVNGEAYCWGANWDGQLGDGTSTNRTVPTPVAGGLTFRAVAAGISHSCGIATSGEAFCWGWNGSGQLGDGTSTQSLEPTPVSGGHTFVHLTAGESHTCGITTTGQALCWGENPDGQLGDGSTSFRNQPTPVAGGHLFSDLSAERTHTCGVTTAGVGLCWGGNADGALGDGTKMDRLTPVAVAGGFVFSTISAGVHHSCGITTSGSSVCWGGFDNGQLGDASSRTNVPVTVPTGQPMSQVSSGASHTCGVTTTDAGYCWGHNFSGGLGDGTTVSRELPTPVSGGLSFAQLVAGQGHSCGLTTGGEAYCWGYNDSGQIGDGTGGFGIQRELPTPVLGGLTFAQMASAGRFTCGVTTGDRGRCWGNNFHRTLGDGSTTDRHTPTPIYGDPAYQEIAAGLHNGCALTPDGAAYCWGDGGFGTVGYGSTFDVSTPIAVSGGLTFESISLGRGNHACGVAVGGAAYCWGRNDDGQVGDGTTGFNRTVPTAVVGGLTFASVSVGGRHSCGITTDGDAVCWGDNPSGQLGDGTFTSSSTPTPVSGGVPLVQISSGDQHTCGLTGTGDILCWGRNEYGQLGFRDPTVPGLVSGGITFTLP